MNAAVISECGRYRYALTRGCEPRLAFIMLNPSTADADRDDPTIRRCMNFARREGAAGIEVMNLYALRATDPSELWKNEDRIGPENDQHLIDLTHRHRCAVIAWGNNAEPERSESVIELLRENGHGLVLTHLGMTKALQPRHPLYVHGDEPFKVLFEDDPRPEL